MTDPSELTIESGVKMPTPATKPDWAAKFGEMNEKDSFLCDMATRDEAYSEANRLGHQLDFAIESGQWRVWLKTKA